MIFLVMFMSIVASAEPASQKIPIESPARVSFADAYERIQKRNLNVQSQVLNVETARALKLSQVGTFTPSLSVVGTATQQGLSPAPSGFSERYNSAALSLTANLFRSGTDFAALKASNRDIGASEETLSNEKLKSEDDAATALINFIARMRSRALIAQIVTLKEESLKIARERFNKGLLPSQEVDKTQVDLDNAEARLIDADVALAAAKAAVDSRLGASLTLDIDWPWKAAVITGPKIELAAFKIDNRPDYRSALETIEAEDWRRHAARSKLLPSLDLVASYGNANLDQPDRRDWSAVLTLTIPLFERFQGWSESRIQSLKKQQAEIAREAIARQAATEIDSLSVAFRAARESAVAREKTAKLTQRLFADNLQRFRLGRASANDLAFDQSRLLETQILEVEGWSTAHLSLMRLCHTLGRTLQANGSCQPL